MALSLLLPLDGSEASLRAVDWLLAQLPEWKSVPTVHLLNVQPSLHGDISRFVGAEQLAEYHADEGRKALAAGAARLRAAGLAVHEHVVVGESAPTIIDVAQREGCQQIALGSRGHGGLKGVLLGSVASRLADISPLPLVLIR